MSATNISVLKNMHEGRKVYVVCAGASMAFLPCDFFWGETVIAVNEMFRHVPKSLFCNAYVLMHHSDNAQEAIDVGGYDVVVSDRAYDLPRWLQPNVFEGDYYQYRTTGYELSLTPYIDIEHVKHRKDDELVVSACTTAEAVQFAAHLGASAIILCGADGGTLDGKLNVDGYNGGAATNPQHVRLTEPVLLAVCEAYRAQGIPVVSLNPFINLNLEGHVFKAPKQVAGRELLQELATVYPS